MSINYEKSILTVESAIRREKRKSILFDHPIKKGADPWSPVMKGNLISDILQENPIPDLVFVGYRRNILICIDGKQRFMNIRDFVENEYRIEHNINRYMIEYQTLTSNYDGTMNCINHKFDIRMKKFKDLPKELQERILDYNLDVTLIDYQDSDSIEYHVKRFNSWRDIHIVDTQLGIEQELEIFKKENEHLRKKLEILEEKHLRLGRKERFNNDDKKRILDMRSKGYSIDKIKDIMQCSKGLVHKIIKEYTE